MEWKDLTLRERAELIKIGVQNGLSNISDIKDYYNKFEKGGPKKESSYSAGHLVDALYESAKEVRGLNQPWHNYVLTQSEEMGE